MNEPEKKESRRSTKQIDQDILIITQRIIEQTSFTDLSFPNIAKEIGSEPKVLYRRFGNVNGLLAHFANQYAYWLADLVDESKTENQDFDEQVYLKEVLHAIVEDLYQNKSMQQLLLWELIEDEGTIKDHLHKREYAQTYLLKIYERMFKRIGIKFNSILALIQGGIYYQILFKRLAVFGGINYDSMQGKEEMLFAIDQIVDMLFERVEPDKEILKIAKRMKADGLDSQTIAKYTQLGVREIDRL